LALSEYLEAILTEFLKLTFSTKNAIREQKIGKLYLKW